MRYSDLCIKIKNIVIKSIFLSVFLTIISTIAAQNAASFSKGFYNKNPFQTHLHEHALSHLFQNTSKLILSGQSSTMLTYSTHHFDYKEFTGSTLIKTKSVPIAIGYSHVYTNSIIETQENSGSTRGIAIGNTFSNTIKSLHIATAYPLSKKLGLGTKIMAHQESLYNDSASGLSIDFSGHYNIYHWLNIGFYTENIFQINRNWKKSNTIESLEKNLIFDITALHKYGNINYQAKENVVKLASLWSITKEFTLIIDHVNNNHIKQNSVGLILDFLPFSCHYSIMMTNQNLGDNKHQFAVLFQN